MPRLERGRGGHDLEGRARAAAARRRRSRRAPGSRRCAGRAPRRRRGGRRAPSRPPPGGACRSWSAPAGAGRGLARASTRLARQQLAARAPGAAGARTPPRARSARPASPAREAVRVEGARAPRAVSWGSSVPAIESAIAPSGERARVGAGPLGEHLAVARQQRGAPGGRLRRVSALAAAQPREHEQRRPGHLLARHRERAACRAGAPKTRVSTTTGTVTAPPSTPAGSPASIELGRGGGGRVRGRPAGTRRSG